jgi:protein-S-isoprenylcysteine O-methyltransferase Ste14
VPSSSTSETQSIQQDRDTLVRIGGWLFRKRTSLPLPVVAALILIPAPAESGTATWAAVAGAALVAVGELIRMWGVHHIGAISRTRSDRLGPLVDSGPFACVRNPLYLGNGLLWIGFTVAAHLLWLAPIVAALLAFEYHAIVRWEERLLETRMGRSYRDYMQRVPRWIPRWGYRRSAARDAAFSWQQTLFSERGTLMAIAVGGLALWLKANLTS